MKVTKKNGKMVIKVKKGALHKALGVKPDDKLTAKQEQVEPSDSELMRKRKQFAINAKKWNHGGSAQKA